MDALELGVGCLNALFLAGILYQQSARSNVEERVISLNVARWLVIGVAVAVIGLSVITIAGISLGGAA